ncbi:hypothetical protein [Fibrobacter sp.]|uniref:hypothetical protein n=1 Tax=Fibrobacter sp. TaxID=35828 RepID=UPI0038643B55
MGTTNILLSIHPEWAELIYSCEKQVEWRKSIPRQINYNPLHKEDRVRVYMYETAPYGCITGYFELADVDRVDTHGITEDDVLVKMGRVPFADLVKYQGKSDSIFAWRIGTNTKFNNNQLMTLEDFGLRRAPQSWCYTDINI